jgi:hypothetical protein
MNLISLALKANSWTPSYNTAFVQKDVVFDDAIWTELKVIKVKDRRE